MEVAAVGGAFLSASLQVLFDRMSSRDFINFFRGRKHEKGLLEKLKFQLLAVKPLLEDAEFKQWTDPAVKAWMDELKDVIYHADDLLDEIATEAMQSKLGSEFPTATTTTTTTRALGDLLVSWSPFGTQGIGKSSRIEQIIERLEHSVKAKESLRLREVISQNNYSSHSLPPTTSLVDHHSVIGRDDDKEQIIQLLISDDDSSGDPVGVIPIVGMGGIGKTTLAQLVYNDSKVVDHFEIKSWICVSEEFNIFKVTKSILEELNLPCSADNLNTLQVNLRNGLAGKKFLIVLDDVWNENENNWEILRSPFGVGKHGSKIVVTTRNEGVASIMRNVPIFHLKQLSHEDCWLIFAKKAFENVSSSVPPNLELIGRKIVEKGKGLPLAAKTLGGLLRHKQVGEWESVLESHFWDLPKDKCNIIPALLLSYHHLPSHLKPCFAYCATIPKDYAFEKDELVPLWIAERFVQQPRTNRSIEEIGDDYFRELLSRSLFQQYTDHMFLMHDLINDLAQFVAGEYCFRFPGGNRHDISKVRYCVYSQCQWNQAFAKFKPNNEASCLRTFKPLSLSLLKESPPQPFSKKVLHDLLPTLRCLRVLSLSHFDVVELPDSIGNLIHLRYLDLSDTPIKCLPETICTMCNLETLLLRGCCNLTRLPNNLCELLCLRHLDISRTGLQEMPEKIGRLRNLQRLTNFIVGNQTGSAISELRELCHLRGTLSISNLENVNDVKDALEANLKNKKHIEELNLEWVAEHTDDSQKERVVLEKLQPHVNLKHLTIKNYGGTRFPDWLGDCSFSNLKSLHLLNCSNCCLLPPFGQLPSLQELAIVGMNMVTEVGSEFYGDVSSVIKPFHSLEKLTFKEMPEWEKWSLVGVGEFFQLLELCIRNCPKLKGEFPKHLPYLKKLEISGCQHPSIEYILKLDDQMVTDSATGAVSVQHLSSLQVLEIFNISKLQILPLELWKLTNLEELNIQRCPKLHTIQIKEGDRQSLSTQPEEEMKLVNTKLKRLIIYDCPKLELTLSADVDAEHHYKCLQYLRINRSYDSLISFPLGFFPKLCSLIILSCRNVESVSVLDGLQTLTSLKHLQIWDCPNFVSFADGGGLSAPNLTSIYIRSCKKLKALPEQMCTLLPSLQSLHLRDLPEIESFPSGGLPKSLSVLFIYACDKLMARRKEWGLQRLPSVRHCYMRGECEEEEDKLLLESFPEECLLPTSLTHLYIINLPNLKSLNPSGLRHLNSLEQLFIDKCPNLQSLPDEGLPSSLSTLIINGCPLLEERCRSGIGEDWPKISHIPSITLNGEFLEK